MVGGDPVHKLSSQHVPQGRIREGIAVKVGQSWLQG